MEYTLHRGDCLAVLRTMADASVDAIVTDPPYGLTSDGGGPSRKGQDGPYGRARAGAARGGFMGLAWDSGVPGVEIWAECLRVLKPGGHLLAFAGTRTQHRMAVNIEDAGFEIRDMIAWVYGSGFPKSRNLDGEWRGWGTALKPALEPITVARRPLAGTVAANMLQHGTGALNIDGCRVGGEGGRWPANLIHDGTEEVVALFPESTSGAMKAGTMRAAQEGPGSVCYGTFGGNFTSADIPASTGSAARFFYCAKASRADRNAGMPSSDTPAVAYGATMREREDADWGARNGNFHPTVKPTDLMAYLVRLVTPPGGLVLDPFMGSGSTGKACMREGFRFVGIDLDDDGNGNPLGYVEIARARIEHERQRVQQAPPPAPQQLDLLQAIA
ncbi:site-specific DNA-methyltransferase [Acidovorax sp. PRC11]|uniref:DNA-methyltransferase n=1 Tax=Acidovorax sp. PRC11 TaxID=2962592 RepID=UPI002881A62D|nr:site-specific DNA-methyltransferase [Acidovorax sp. PRC11]MDT0138073.1 site-specific DNA-methyltransferase [Acidovorax sp. PRC11]